MNRRIALLGTLPLSLLLTGCPLTDNYRLMSEEAGSSAAGASGDVGGTSSSGAPNLAGGSSGSGTVSGEAGMAEAGESALGGAPSAGSSGTLGASGTSGSSGTAGTTGGASAAGGSAGSASTCNGSLTFCVASCIDLTTDPLNCGACGKACNAGRSCSASVCQGGWVSVKAAPLGLVARSKAASVALGKSVFIWGGQDGSGKALDDGAIYSPAKDSWTYLSKDAGAPTARIMATALWTGSVVIVFGGTDATGNTVYRDGSIYDPVANSWSALPASGAISRRSAPFAFWDGTRALFWGGLGATGFGVPNADRFDLTSWSTSTNSGDPGALSFPAVAFDGSVVYLMGGQLNGNRQDKVFAYSTSTDSWTNLTKSLLTARSSAFGAWDGSHFVVWGGRDDANGLRNDGKYLSGTTWTSLNTAVGSGVPSPRLLAFRRSGWSFQTSPGAFAVMGGQVSVTAAATLSTNGGSYNVALQQWSSIPDWPSADVHEYGMGVWTGEEFVVWGGRDATGVTSTGDRWAP